MQFPAIAAIAAIGALIATTVTAQDDLNRFSIWDSKDCSGSPSHSFSGSSTITQNFVTGYNGYIGSIKFDQSSKWSDQVQDGTDCIYTAVICCRYAPTCRSPTWFDWSACNTVDQRVLDLVIGNTQCDTLCWDNIYGKDVGPETAAVDSK